MSDTRLSSNPYAHLAAALAMIAGLLKVFARYGMFVAVPPAVELHYGIRSEMIVKGLLGWPSPLKSGCSFNWELTTKRSRLTVNRSVGASERTAVATLLTRAGVVAES